MSSFSEIDVAEVETCADEMLGPVSGNEYDLLLSKLAGARGNRVFSFFGIEAISVLLKLFSLFRNRGKSWRHRWRHCHT